MRKKYSIKAFLYDKKGRVLAVGENSYTKTHPIQVKLAHKHNLKEKIFLHAEIAALVKLKNWDNVYRIKIERYDKKGKPRNAKPCPICQDALDQAGVQIIEHT